MKITKVPGNGNYETFQRFSFDPYLGSAKRDFAQPAHDTLPVFGSTLKEVVRTRMKKFSRMVKEVSTPRESEFRQDSAVSEKLT